MPPLQTKDTAEAAARAVVAKFQRLADRRGFIEIRPSEIAALAIDLGYRSSHWAHGEGMHWLAAQLATVDLHPAMPNFRYRSGFLEPAQAGPEYLAASLNRLLHANGAGGNSRVS